MADGSNLNNLDWSFPVESQPIFDQLGNEIDGNCAIVRTDTNQVLGVHGSRYQMVRHDDVVNSIIDAVNEANIGGEPEVRVTCVESGRKLRGEILFNDLTVQPQVGDYVKYRVSFFNSYDGSWAFDTRADGLRLWCLNGCTTADASARSKFKHTQSISVEGAAKKILLGLETFMNMPEVWNSWRQTWVSSDMAEEVFRKTLAKAPGNIKGLANNKQLDKLLGIYNNEVNQLGANKWALYNAATYWASHTGELKNPEVARRNREDQVAAMLKSKVWEDIR